MAKILRAVRHRLILLLAGDMPVVMNCKVKGEIFMPSSPPGGMISRVHFEPCSNA